MQLVKALASAGGNARHAQFTVVVAIVSCPAVGDIAAAGGHATGAPVAGRAVAVGLPAPNSRHPSQCPVVLGRGVETDSKVAQWQAGPVGRSV